MTLDLPADISALSDEELQRLTGKVFDVLAIERKENQIRYFRPPTPDAERVIRSSAQTIGVGGGNRSGKTTNCLVRNIGLATGIFPEGMAPVLRAKFKGPLRCRMIVESLTTTLHPIILPKLQWWQWSGLAPAGGGKGHWGWIPRDCLVDRDWAKSWSEKLRTLTVLCRDPGNPAKVLGHSTIQFMSFDQDASDHASGDFDIVHVDEPPPYAVWRENQARVMSVGGTIQLSMTWPDDPAIPVDWIFDEIYDRGQPGPQRNPAVEWIELDTMKNPHLDQGSILQMQSGWSEATRLARIKGQPIRFSNRIHPLFSDVEQAWCFACAGPAFTDERGVCAACGGDDTERFCHVAEFAVSATWPVVFVLDPHPRKPHMFLWCQVDPSDDLWVFAEGQVDGDPGDVRDLVASTDSEFGVTRSLSLVDPNMGASPASARTRGLTWQQEFENFGLPCDLADDSDVGRKRINEYLKPDPRTRRPRLTIHARCASTIYQIKRYTWQDSRRKDERDVKEKAREKYDDMPTMLKYVLNFDPSFRLLHHGAPVVRHPGKRRKGY